MSEHVEESEEEGTRSPKPPPFKRAPSFEVVIDPMDEPWEWPAKNEKTEATSDDSDDDFFGRGSAASNEEVVTKINIRCPCRKF